MFINELNKTQLPYISTFNSVKDNHTKSVCNIFEKLKSTYQTNSILNADKLKAETFSSGIFSDDNDYTINVVRDKNLIKRWCGVLVYDFDFDKELKKEYLIGKNKKLVNDIDTIVKSIYDFFVKIEINVKVSGSGCGIHAFLVIDNNHLSNEDTLKYMGIVFDYYQNIFENLIQSEVARKKLSHIPFGVDIRFRQPSQMVALSKSKYFKVDYDRVFTQHDLNDIINNVEENSANNISDTINFNLNGTSGFGSHNIIYDEVNLTEIKKIFSNLLPSITTKIGDYTKRITVANTLVYLGFDKSIIHFLIKYDNTSYNEWNGYFNTAQNYIKRNRFNEEMIKIAFYYIKKASVSNINFIKKKYVYEGFHTDTSFSVNKYLTESDNVYKALRQYIIDNDKVLLQAPTGSGKSKFAVKLANELFQNDSNKFIVITADTIALAKQISSSYELKLICGDTIKILGKPKNCGVYVSTYDGLKHFHKIDFLIVDEAHQLVNAISYRKDAINVLNEWINKTKTLAITATPKYLFPLMGNFKFIEISVSDKIKNKYLIYRKEKSSIEKKVLDIIINNPLDGSKAFVYINSKDKLMKIKSYLNKNHPEYRVVIINSLTKEEKGNFNTSLDYICLASIQDNSLVPDNVDIILATSILQNGINILNENISYVITNELEETNLIQFVARFRKGVKDNIFLLADTLDDNIINPLGYTEYIYRTKALSSNCYDFNKNQTHKSDVEFSLYNKKEKALVLNYDTNSYEINPFRIAFDIWERNRFIYRKNPNLLLDAIQDNVLNIEMSDTNVKSISQYYTTNTLNLSSFKNIEMKIKMEKDKNRNWYFEDRNFVIVNECIGNKNNTNNNFYNDYKDNINDTGVKFLNGRLEKLNNGLKQLNYTLPELDLKALVKDTKKEAWVIMTGTVFNYVLKESENNIRKGKLILKKINTVDEILFNFLWDIKESFELDKKYTWEDIKSIISILIFSKKNYEKYFYKEFKSDNFLKGCLDCVFSVDKRRIMKDKNRQNYYTFNEFVLDNRFKDVYQSIVRY